ncbi:hypothetical protein FDG66_gp48 [Streptomyces phage phiCAM]|uniref:Uncharacterized protein n=1 Tax=Streptomyces phage phiCAM TaxID=1239386 RepID=K4NZM1_9CAUD|nr:hypothetical protein FDG66_gp48 [Streptomyces phage phiCAM]AFV51368.1 hypothetical protein [Streptomyces phage phiCAM]
MRGSWLRGTGEPTGWAVVPYAWGMAMTGEELKAHYLSEARKVVATWPPMTDEQKRELTLGALRHARRKRREQST